MSILSRLKEQKGGAGKKIFGVVAGPRLGGKTTLAGTLPGRTLLLQSAVLESGSDSAKALATRNKNELFTANFSSVKELSALIKELTTDTDFDNVYVDGLSALTEMKLREPNIQLILKKNVWDGYRELGQEIQDVLLTLKELTYSEKATKPKNVFVTCALKIEHDTNGNVKDVSLETKGNLAVTAVTKLGEVVVTVLPPQRTEGGETPHKLITRTTDWWPGRIDGLLKEDNPGEISPADLSKLLKLRGA